MFGLKIIRKKELQQIRQSNEQLNETIKSMNVKISLLDGACEILQKRLAKFDRKRVNGKFVKSTI